MSSADNLSPPSTPPPQLKLVRTPPLLGIHKVVMVGDGGVGKTTYLKRLHTGHFEKKYIATMGADVTPLPFSTNKGDLTFNVWDCSGQEKFSGLADGYYIGAEAVVVFFDVTSRVSYRNASAWIDKVRAKLGNEVPIVLVGNKVDCRDFKIRPDDITLHREKECLAYYDISAKSNYNFEKPFLTILRHLHGQDTNFRSWTHDPLTSDDEALNSHE